MFECQKCGACCKVVGKSEMYRQLDRGDGCCRYLDIDTNECNIYNQRPLLCRVDEAYEVIFSAKLSLDKYYELNYEACKILKEKMGKIL